MTINEIVKKVGMPIILMFVIIGLGFGVYLYFNGLDINTGGFMVFSTILVAMLYNTMDGLSNRSYVNDEVFYSNSDSNQIDMLLLCLLSILASLVLLPNMTHFVLLIALAILMFMCFFFFSYFLIQYERGLLALSFADRVILWLGVAGTLPSLIYIIGYFCWIAIH